MSDASSGEPGIPCGVEQADAPIHEVERHPFVISADGVCVYEVADGQFCGAPRQAAEHA